MTRSSNRATGGGYSRRGILLRGITVLGVAGLAGCSSGGSSEEYRFRIGDGEWTALSPIETEESHEVFYHDGDATETTNATHPFVEADTATMFLHRNTTADDGSDDALVLTYDAGSGDTGGQARVEFDEEIAPAEDLLVADGPFGRESAQTGDTYEGSQFLHQWGGGNTDGVVLSLAPFSDPTFEFTDTAGLDELRILSAQDGDTSESARTGMPTTVDFEF